MGRRRRRRRRTWLHVSASSGGNLAAASETNLTPLTCTSDMHLKQLEQASARADKCFSMLNTLHWPDSTGQFSRLCYKQQGQILFAAHFFSFAGTKRTNEENRRENLKKIRPQKMFRRAPLTRAKPNCWATLNFLNYLSASPQTSTRLIHLP